MNKQEKSRYVNDVFNTIAHQYDFMNLLLTWGMVPFWQKKIMKLSNLKLGNRGLDLCCGTGEMAFQMKEMVGPYGEVIGIDFSEEMLAVAKEKMQKKI